MTRDELLATLTALAENQGPDVEDIHIEADRALLAYIDDPQVTAAYDEVRKWYA